MWKEVRALRYFASPSSFLPFQLLCCTSSVRFDSRRRRKVKVDPQRESFIVTSEGVANKFFLAPFFSLISSGSNLPPSAFFAGKTSTPARIEQGVRERTNFRAELKEGGGAKKGERE